MVIDFTKSHGLGNDFIIIDDLDGQIDVTPEMTRAVCDRHFGIGGDGLIITRKSEVADYFMDFRNSDGSVAEMCGNGIRAFAKYIYDHLLQRPHLTIATLAGVKTIDLTIGRGAVEGVKVDMGEPVFANEKIPLVAGGEDFINRPLAVAGRDMAVTCLSMGNPHCVVFVDDLSVADVAGDGRIIENMSIFPERTNVEFVQVLAADRLRVKVWERGVGETLACGTGACAAAIAANVNGLAGREATVELPGGALSVVWLENNHVSLSGRVEEVFTGRFDRDRWLKTRRYG